MRLVKCYDCGKRYNYDEDGFCPKCGGFNQPAHISRVSADGSVVRVDGLNERGHAGSFVHQEYHAEERQRKGTGLSKGVSRVPQEKPATRKPSPKVVPAGKTLAGSSRQAEKGVGLVVALVIWLLSLIFGFFL